MELIFYLSIKEIKNIAGPVQRRKTSVRDEIHKKYHLILQKVNGGELILDAVKAVGLSKPNFYKWRAVAELKIIDGEQYKVIEKAHGKDLQTLQKQCEDVLQEETYCEAVKDMKKNGDIL